MKIDIMHIAKLARLKIDGDEAALFETQMQDIVNMVEQMPEPSEAYQHIDPEHPMELRHDEVIPSQRREELFSCAPAMQAGCVVVPKTLE